MVQKTAAAGFLRIPPFPGARSDPLTISTASAEAISDRALDQLLVLLGESKVGGSYWGSQPELPSKGYTVIRVTDRKRRREELERARSPVLDLEPNSDVDPWHVLSGAGALVTDADDALALVAATMGVQVRCVGQGQFSTLETGSRAALRVAFRSAAVDGISYRNPFSNEKMDLSGAIELCAFWRRLIDSNRDLTVALGFAFWKRKTVAPLLWDGGRGPPFTSERRSFETKDRVAVWKSRTSPRILAGLARSGAEILEVEDGFIRSAGLGADCVPPLSIVVDKLGIYFDPRQPSDLEMLLQQGHMDPQILIRASHLRQLIVDLGIGKYGAGTQNLELRRSQRPGRERHVLVVGQVEDDRAVMAGLGPTTNLQLLTRVREENPDSYILYKPHPDVEAGHRAGIIPDKECLQLADEIVRDLPMSSLIDHVHEVHVNTSLAGFEALLRGKEVITYGVPFYAGWGLTRDLGPIPNRRSAKRNIDELVAAALLLYPRYLDPVTGLPCPPEILVRRIAEGGSKAKPTQLVRLRRLQGKLKRKLAALRSNR